MVIVTDDCELSADLLSGRVRLRLMKPSTGATWAMRLNRAACIEMARALLDHAEKMPAEMACSFCGKSQHVVQKLIVGGEVSICDECTELCMDIVVEARG